MTKIIKGLWVLGVFFIGIGGYFLYLSISNSNWDSVEGTIVSTSIPATISTSSTALQRHIVYAVEVSYRYSVDNKEYHNNRFSIGTGDTVKGGFNEKADAQTWLNNSDYAIGNNVTVYTNPQSPKDSLLSTSINIGTIMPIILGLLFIGTSYLFAFILNKQPLEKS